jgi:hypothetical protein
MVLLNLEVLSPEFPTNISHIYASESLEKSEIPPKRLIFSAYPEVSLELADPDDRQEWDTLLALCEENRNQITELLKSDLAEHLACRIVNTVPESHSSALLQLYLIHFELVESILELGVPSRAIWEIERNGITDGPGASD